MPVMSPKVKALLVLTAFGLIVSTYLTIKAHDPSGVVCSIGGSCETVLSSQYARFFGLPTSAWGIIWYAVGFVLIYLTFIRRRYPWSYFFLWVLSGLIFSLYLFGLEIFRIHAYCTWCLSSLFAVILLFIITLLARKEITNERGQ